VYGIGYEGLTLDQIVSRVAGAGIETLVDVRMTPSSRRPGFSKRPLAAALQEKGIAYVHEPDLGNPPENRATFRTNDPTPGRLGMRRRLENGSGPALQRLVDRTKNETVAILCVERFEENCHRQVILEMAKELDRELESFDIW
jgi:uncharacterized protein (DUF488 family)